MTPQAGATAARPQPLGPAARPLVARKDSPPSGQGSDRLALSAPVRPLGRSLAPTAVDKVESWIGSSWYNRLVKLPTKYMFALDHPEKVPNPRITVDSAEYTALKKALKPGDVILCGNDDSFVHGIVYLGNGEIVHSLAQDKPGRPRNVADWLFDSGSWLAARAPLPGSWREAVAMRFRALPRSTGDGIGVIHETLDSYFARAHRDNAVVLRNPKLTAEDLAAMRRFALAQVGKPYDYGFSTFDDSRLYCTELVVKTLMQSRHAPRISGLPGGAGPIRREMVLNEGIIKSPDLVPVWKANGYERTPFGQSNPIHVRG